MLRFNLTHLFKARGIERPSEYLIESGFSAGTATKIKQGRSHMLNLKHVEMLCEKLNCTPNDLIEWVPTGNQRATESHPLAPLQYRDFNMEVIHAINGLPYQKLQQLTALLKELK